METAEYERGIKMKKVPLSEVTCPWCGETMDDVKRVDNVRAADGMHSGIQCNHCGIKMAGDVFDLDNMMLISDGSILSAFGEKTDENIEEIGLRVSNAEVGSKKAPEIIPHSITTRLNTTLIKPS